MTDESTNPIPGAGVDLEDQLQQLRSQNQQLQNQLQEFQGRDASQSQERLNMAHAEVEQLRSQLTETSSSAIATRLQLDAYRQLNKAGLRPDYEDLVLPFAQRSLTYDQDGNLTAGDQAPTEFFNGLKQRFPDAFHADGDSAGTGGAADGGQPVAKSPQQYTTDNGLITGVEPEAVLDGGVVIR